VLSDRNFVKQSLETNLFFLRIMKEHVYFMDISLPEKYADLKKQAKIFANIFNELLVRTIHLSNGVVNLKECALTKYTLSAEKATELFTGAPIDRNTTRIEMQLGYNNNGNQYNPMLVQNAYMLNCQILEAVKGVITFKTNLLNAVLECRVFSTNYPSMLKHLIEEAQSYADTLVKLQNRLDPTLINEAPVQEAFWNHIMGDHAKFIRGLLDPSHEDLIYKANDFANEFDELRKEALEAARRANMIEEVTDESLEATERIRDFKEDAMQGILDCEIHAIAVPLLVDHVLREANHYINGVLEIYKEQL
jgi:hypothetical protein